MGLTHNALKNMLDEEEFLKGTSDEDLDPESELLDPEEEEKEEEF
jgi:hypothetical protein